MSLENKKGRIDKRTRIAKKLEIAKRLEEVIHSMRNYLNVNPEDERVAKWEIYLGEVYEYLFKRG